MRYSLILVVGLLLAFSTYAQTEDTQVSSEEYSDDYSEESYSPVDPVVVSKKKGYNTERVNVKRFDKKKWEEIIDGQDYTEDQRALKRKKQLQEQERKRQEQLKREQSGNDSGQQERGGSESGKGRQRFNQSESDEEEDSDDESTQSSSSTPINSPILSIIVYAVAIGIIAYILFLIFKNTSFKSKGKIKAGKQAFSDPSAVITDIKELEIDRLLREAIASGNYKLAIRICYLGLLKKLDEDGVIIWKKDKTNRDYLSELFSKDMYFNEVRNLTLAYEEVWYGEHNLPVQSYERIISSFKEVDQKLNASRPR